MPRKSPIISRRPQLLSYGLVVSVHELNQLLQSRLDILVRGSNAIATQRNITSQRCDANFERITKTIHLTDQLAVLVESVTQPVFESVIEEPLLDARAKIRRVSNVHVEINGEIGDVSNLVIF